jgi:hypothetical protein
MATRTSLADIQRAIIVCNPVAERLFCHTAACAPGRWFDLISPQRRRKRVRPATAGM